MTVRRKEEHAGAVSGRVTSAAARWQRELLAWAIPAEIEAAADRSPWGHSPERFALRADTALAEPGGASYDRAVEALARPGTVLDVGAGVGAAGLPLLPNASRLTAVDPSGPMVEMLAQRAAALSSIPTRTVVGRWPEVAKDAGVHDVVVAHHVVYDVPDLHPFLVALTGAARRRVVIELPPRHPLTWMAPLWLEFQGIVRPTEPTADTALALIEAMGVADLRVDRWVTTDPRHPVDVALITRRLCLPESAEPRVAAARDALPPAPRDVVTVSWSGSASAIDDPAQAR